MKMDYEAQEKCLSTKTTKFMEYLIRRGLLPDRNLVDQESAARRQEIAQKAYHNTELLLQNYRELVWALETTPDQIASELEMPFATLDELIDRIDLESALGNSKVENRLISVAKSRVLIDRIHEAVSVLRKKPKVGEDLYRVIYKTFLDPNFRGTVLDLLYQLNLSKRKYYELRKKAIRLISLRLWSAPNQEVDMWIEVVMMVQEKKD
jgi:hypothetical protein